MRRLWSKDKQRQQGVDMNKGQVYLKMSRLNLPLYSPDLCLLCIITIGLITISPFMIHVYYFVTQKQGLEL